MPSRQFSQDAVRRALAILVGLTGLILAARHPLGGGCGIMAFCATAALLYFKPDLWIWALPIALAIGDLYPWTGHLLVTESDLFLLATFAVLLWRDDAYSPLFLPRRQIWLLWLPLAISASVSLLRGWNGLPPSLPGDELSLYVSQWNAVRVFKGFAWGIILAQILIAQFDQRADRLGIFCRGMQASALVVALLVIGERLMTVGLFDFHKLYRATGPFFSMHIGGEHIDTYWAMTLPFLFLPPRRAGSWLNWLARFGLLAVSLYAIGATMSRGVIVVAGLATLTLAIVVVWAARNQSNRGRWYIFAFAVMLLLLASSPWLFDNGIMQRRFATTAADWRIRWNHWSALCHANSHEWTTATFGTGLGSLPIMASAACQQPSRTAELVRVPDGRVALRLRPGTSMFIEQLVDITAPSPWTIRADVQHDGAVDVHTYICEKTLLESFRCVGSTLGSATEPGVWQSVAQSIKLDELALAPKHLLHIPATFALSASGDAGSVDISDLRVDDARGNSVLTNSDFRAGTAHWLFTSDDHLSWRAKNLWVHLYVEQGWLGIVTFAWLVLGVLVPLSYRAVMGRDLTLCVLVIAIVGFVAMGIVGSLLDTPPLTQLFCVLLAVSQGSRTTFSRLSTVSTASRSVESMSE